MICQSDFVKMSFGICLALNIAILTPVMQECQAAFFMKNATKK